MRREKGARCIRNLLHRVARRSSGVSIAQRQTVFSFAILVPRPFRSCRDIISTRDYSMVLSIPWLSAGWAVKSRYATYRNGFHFAMSLHISVDWYEDQFQKHLSIKYPLLMEIVEYHCYIVTWCTMELIKISDEERVCKRTFDFFVVDYYYFSSTRKRFFLYKKFMTKKI